MRIRKLEVADSPIVRATAQTLAARMYPEFIPDIEKLHWLVRDAINGSTHYAFCVGPVGEPDAVLIGRVQNNTWAMKKSAAILLWYSNKAGEGVALLRDFKAWVSRDPQIVVAGITADWAGDQRSLHIVQRLGFKQRGSGTFAFFPRGDKSGSR